MSALIIAECRFFNGSAEPVHVEIIEYTLGASKEAAEQAVLKLIEPLCQKFGEKIVDHAGEPHKISRCEVRGLYSKRV